jgi:peptidoglycan/LPS O-acetylase OafA/YrhL
VGIAYRREVDGLRAVAVVPVVLFHAGIPGIGGGYIGVDVFFVISGFLITSIILTEQAAGTFTLLGFYERRARRVLPALFVVMLASLATAWVVLLPDAFVHFGKSLASASAFASNIFFWRTSGYFAPVAEDIPLLHTWSLAVEEQYYLFFPILLLALPAVRRDRLVLVLVGIAIASLAFAEWAWRAAPQANFYLLPSRAWELMVGALLAVALSRHELSAYLGRRTRNVLAFAGLLMVSGAMVYFDAETPVPSVYAIVPVLGAALIVAAAGRDTLVGRLLGSPPFVFVGLISYSIYLWHVPLLSFAKATLLDPPSLELRLSMIAATFALAVLTWRFVETPMRRRDLLGRGTVLSSAVVISSLLVIGGLGIAANDGFRSRFQSYFIAFDREQARRETWKHVEQAEADEEAMRRSEGRSSIATGETRLSVGVMGNSHGKDLFNALHLSGLDLALQPVITNNACRDRGWRKLSDAWIACNFAYQLRPDMKWNADRYVVAPQWSNRRIDALPKVLERLKRSGKPVAVFGNTAEFQDIPSYFAKSIGFGGDESPENLGRIARRLADTLRAEKLDSHNARVRAIAERHGVPYFDRAALVCPQAPCPFLDEDGKYLFYDYGHLTMRGAELVGGRLAADRRFLEFLGLQSSDSASKVPKPVSAARDATGSLGK